MSLVESTLTSRPGIETLLSKTVTLPLLAVLSYFLYTKPVPSNSSSPSQPNEAEKKKKSIKEFNTPPADPEFEYSSIDIKPVSDDFDWKATPPFKYRPFKKGEYKLVMGINNIPQDEWLMMEDTYADLTKLKRSFVKDPEINKHISYINDECIPALKEFYEASVTFMMKRYPKYFEVVEKEDGLKWVHNKVLDDYIELDPNSVAPPMKLIENLAGFIEEDFIILFPDSENPDGEYYFKGGCFGFAGGFYPSKVFNAPLTAVHGPVPDYKTKLRSQMNKFFDKVKPGVFVRRNNWSLQVDPRILIFDGNKGSEESAVDVNALKAENIDFARECFFRSERQTLMRLHRSKAIVFCIRTYLTSLKDIRDEGLGDELIGGITGMQEILGIYKNRPKWGDAATEYLMGKTDGTDKPWIKRWVL